MNFKKANAVNLPRIPLAPSPTSPQEDFWLQQGSSGAIQAFRQLSSTLHKGGRKVKSLPGGKLKPLFRNFSQDGSAKQSNVLPHISGAGSDSVGASHQQVLVGEMDNLPELSPYTVRVYLCSNYGDQSAERRILHQRAVPQLEAYSSQLGLHFQLVDLHRGGSSADQSRVGGAARELRAREISDCQRLSLGPNFVLLLGERYGSPQLPPCLTPAEFDLLTSVTSEHAVDSADLLPKAYRKDDNMAHDPAYVLQLTKGSDQAEKVFSVISKALQLALDEEKITKKRYQELMISALEEDINQGILNTSDPRNHCLCYHREFRDISKNLTGSNYSTSLVETSTDQDGNLILDPDLHPRSQALAESMMEHLGVGNCHNYYLTWSGKFLDEDPEFQAYLEKLCEDFVKDMKEMIDSGYKQVARELSGKKSDVALLQREILYHMQKAQAITEHYVRSEESTLFFRLEKFFRDPRQNHNPFIIHGPSGCGKTSTMAALTKKFKEWFSSESVVIVRFLGSTWQSSSMQRTVVSITRQICLAYNLKLPQRECFDTMYQTMVTFRRVLDDVSREFAATRPLFIVLDGIDQLQPYSECLRTLWAIKNFPSNVHVVLSTRPQINSKNILKPLVSMITTEDAMLEVPLLTDDEIRSLVLCILEKSGRKLTASQSQSFIQAVGVSRDPLYIKLLMSRALKLKSSEEISLTVPTDVAGIVDLILDYLENQIGFATVTYCVSYITAWTVGIPERELIELLTQTKEVMDEITKKYFEIPDGSFQFPMAVLSEMKQALKPLMEERLLLGRVVFGWNHQQIYEAISERYDVLFPGVAEDMISDEATNFSLTLHEHFANVFLPNHQTEQLCMLSKPPENQTAISLPQPLGLHNPHILHRLLPQLSILVPIEGLSKVKDEILFNFRWLLTKLQCCPLSVLIQDVVSVFTLVKHLGGKGVLDQDDASEEFYLLLHFLQLTAASITENPENLALEILARLPDLSSTYKSFQTLLKDADEYIKNSEQPWLIPIKACLDTPGSQLRHTFPNATHVLGLAQSKNAVILYSQQHGVSIHRLLSGELEQHFSVNREQALSGVIPGHIAPYVIIAHYSHLSHHMEISAWSIGSGVEVSKTAIPQKFEAIALSLDDKAMYMASTMPLNGTDKQSCIVGIDTITKATIFTLTCERAHKDGIRRLVPVQSFGKDYVPLISIGGPKSKDMVYWNLETETSEYQTDLGCSPDFFIINEEMNISVCCSKDSGKLVVVDLADGSIKLSTEENTLRDLQDVYVSESGEFAVFATHNAGVVVYSLTKGSIVKSLGKLSSKDGEKAVMPTALMMDDTEHLLFVGYQSGLIKICSIINGESLTTLQGHSKAINCLRLVDENTLISASDDQTSKLWHFTEVLDYLDTHLMSGDEQFEAEISETASAESSTSHCEDDGISCMTITQDQKTLITGSGDGPIKLWDLDTGNVTTTYSEKCQYGVSDLYLAYKGKLLIGHCMDIGQPMTRLLQVWCADTGTPVTFDPDQAVRVYTSCAFPSDDRILTISPSTDNRQMGIIVSVYDLFEMKCLSRLHCNIYGNMDCTNLKLLGFTTVPPAETDIDVESLHGDRKHTENEESPTETAKQYAVLDYFPTDGVSFFFNFVLHGPDLKEISMDHHEPVHIDTLSPKCTAVAPKGVCISGSKTGSLVVWNAATQKVVTDFCQTPTVGGAKRSKMAANEEWSHLGAVTCVTVSPDGSHLVSGGVDGKVKVWSLSSMTLEAAFSKHTQEILDIQVSAAGLLSSASADKTLCMWDLNSKASIASFYAHHPVNEVVMTTDRSKVIARVMRGKPMVMILKLVNMK